MMSCTPLSPRSTRWRRKADHPDLSSLAPSQMPRISRKPSELTALATSSETLHLASPGALHHDTVEIEVGMFALNAPVPPGLDLGVDLLVQVRHRARAHPRAPQRLGDVLDAAHRNARQIHLDQRFLDRALPPAVALDDGRLESLAPQLRNLKVDLASAGLQCSFIAASA